MKQTFKTNSGSFITMMSNNSTMFTKEEKETICIALMNMIKDIEDNNIKYNNISIYTDAFKALKKLEKETKIIVRENI